MSEETNNTAQDAPLQSNQIEETTNQKSDPSDQLTPDHPRFKDVLNRAKDAENEVKELREKLDELSKKVDQRKEGGDEELTAEDLAWLDKVAVGLKKRGAIVTPEDLRIEKKAQTYDRLSTKYDGSDGRPKFIPVEVEAHAKTNGFGDNLEAAYKDMHFDALVAYASKKGPTPPSSEKPTGSGGSRDFADNSMEAIMKKAETGELTDAEYDKYRDQIHAHMKSTAKSATIS